MNMNIRQEVLNAPLSSWEVAYFDADDTQREAMLLAGDVDTPAVANLSVAPVAFEVEEPLPVIPPREEAKPYPIHALGPLREAAIAAARMSGAPDALAAQSALAVASTCVQSFADVQTLGGGTAPVSLFLLTVAASGERKSSTEKRLTSALRDWEKSAFSKSAEEREKYNLAGKAWEAKQSGLLVRVKKGGEDGSVAEAALQELDPRPNPPGDPTRLITEPTFEGLTNLLSKSLHRSIGLLAAEGGQFLGGHAMNKDNRQKTVSAFSLLWDGDPIKRTRAADGETKTIADARFSMCLQVQPVIAEELLADPLAQGQGFLARFLIAQPESTIGTRVLSGSLCEAQEMASAQFDLENFGIQATNILLEDDRRCEEGIKRSVIELSYDALGLLRDFYNVTEKAQAKGGWLFGHTAVASKIAEQACRLAGVMALWGNPSVKEIGAQTMRDAIALAEFYLSEAVRLGSAGSVSQADREAEELRVWLLEKWPERAVALGRDTVLVTPRDIARFGPSHLRAAPRYKAALNKLAALGWVIRCEGGVEIDGRMCREAYRIWEG